MNSTVDTGPEIPGTTIFDGEQARKGYALNRMCFSFNSAENRAEFLRDQDAYCTKYGLNPEQRAAVRSLNVLQLIAAGGNAYYLAKLSGIFGLDMQDIGAQQTGVTKEEFKARLAAYSKPARAAGK
ncbi:MAG: protocatechuate 4,5-dioxygenase subunit alpha [Candidatus Levyibacteriota bacterium]